MSALQSQVLQSIDGMSDDNLEFLLEVIRRITPSGTIPDGQEQRLEGDNRRVLGVAKGHRFFADGYDLDDCNDEIADMFGVEG